MNKTKEEPSSLVKGGDRGYQGWQGNGPLRLLVWMQTVVQLWKESGGFARVRAEIPPAQQSYCWVGKLRIMEAHVHLSVS